MRKIKPIDLIIIGAQKAGTTSLNRYLSEHPEICTHKRIEFRYFIDEKEYKQGYEKIFKKYYSHCNTKNKIIAKNIEIMYSLQALKRLCKHNPNIKLVLTLRNPVDRAYSAWLYERRKGRETKTFEEAINIDKLHSTNDISQYIDKSLYYKHLLNVLNFFDKKQIMIILFEDFKKNPLFFCKNIFEWFKVDVNFIPEIKKVHNKAALPRCLFITKLILTDNIFKRIVKLLIPQQVTFKIGKTILKINEREINPPPMNFETKQKLLAYFKPYNQKLAELIQKDLSCWDK